MLDVRDEDAALLHAHDERVEVGRLRVRPAVARHHQAREQDDLEQEEAQQVGVGARRPARGHEPGEEHARHARQVLLHEIVHVVHRDPRRVVVVALEAHLRHAQSSSLSGAPCARNAPDPLHCVWL